MVQELQELLGAYLMPLLIAIPLAIIVLIAALKRDDYRQPPRKGGPQPGADVLAGHIPGLPPLPGLPGPSMASSFVTAPTPMLPPPVPAEPPPAPLVLVADDSAVVRTKLKRLLEGAGLQVLQVNDGNEALALIEARPEIAVLITDLEMPNKDGFELIADVRGGLSSEDLPIVAITGHDELHGRVGQIEGVYGIFKKPWNDRELLKRIQSLLPLRQSRHRRTGRPAEFRTPPPTPST